jgi:MoaA/NifB/PqqE/SkfB family radical SAM enzyme
VSVAAPELKYCVWEITLACNAKCLHCGSTAGAPRTKELTTNEALRLIHELADLGCRSVTLSGGEPLLRSDWPELARAVIRSNMRAELISNGLMAADQADEIAAAGFYAVTLSVDGPEEIHDHLRGPPGGLTRLRRGARALLERGVRLGATTQVNRLNLEALGAIHAQLRTDGFSGWQVQLTRARGRAAQMASLCLRPEELPALESAILRCQQDSDLFIQASDSIGYMSRGEPRLRSGSRNARPHVFTGCHAGLEVVGITSDGAVKRREHPRAPPLRNLARPRCVFLQ